MQMEGRTSIHIPIRLTQFLLQLNLLFVVRVNSVELHPRTDKKSLFSQVKGFSLLTQQETDPYVILTNYSERKQTRGRA